VRPFLEEIPAVFWASAAYEGGSSRLHAGSSEVRLLSVRMPLDFVAFCQLHAEHYLHYAALRLSDGTAGQAVVEYALGDLATAWPRALRSPNPAAAAWRSLSGRVAAAVSQQPPSRCRARDGLHRLLPPAEADAVICHRLMRLHVEETAALLGVAAPTVVFRLSSAAHELGSEVAHLLGLSTFCPAGRSEAGGAPAVKREPSVRRRRAPQPMASRSLDNTSAVVTM